MSIPARQLEPDPGRAPAAQMRPVRLGPRDVLAEHRADGTIRLRSPHALPPYPAKLTERLEHWAATVPGRTWLSIVTSGALATGATSR